jgi:hypothetical protein
MKRLGEILLERGAIAVSELHTGLEACHHGGGRLGTQLLKFGFVDEQALLSALQAQLGVPSVGGSALRRAPEELRRMLPLHVARRLQAVVFRKGDRGLGVAMTNPKNPAALDEIVSFVGLEIEPHVATEAGILAALSEIGEGADDDEGGIENPRDEPTGDGGDAWARLWAPRTLSASDLLRARRRSEPESTPLAATFPGLTPVPDVSSVAVAEGLDDESYRALLHAAGHRDEVGELLLRRATSILDRCCLFAVHTGRVVGWMARGTGVVVDDVQSFAVSLELPSVFSELVGADSFCGEVSAGPVNDVLMRMLGDPAPRQLAIFPVRIKKRVVAFLVGDVPESELPEGVQNHLLPAVRKAGIAFEILIMKKKILAP